MVLDEKKVMDTLSGIGEAMKSMAGVMQGFDSRMKAIEAKPVGGATAASTGPKRLFGGKTGRRAIKDTKTGTVYASLSACSKALAGEFADKNGVALDPLDRYAWYKMLQAAPERFVDATAEETAAAETKRQADIETGRVALQAKLDSEAKAEAAKTTTTTAAPPKPQPAQQGKVK